jgi:hypothetical protein
MNTNRRDFLKISSLASIALFAQFTLQANMAGHPVEARSGDKLYRGTPDGKVYLSSNEGKDWQLHTNFGPEFSVLALSSSHSGQLYTQLEFASHTFELVLAQNNKTWRTV